MGTSEGHTTGIRAWPRACSHVERTRAGRRVVRRTLWTGAQRETSAAQRRRAAPLHGSTPRHGDRGRSALCATALAGACRPPPQAASPAAAARSVIARNLLLDEPSGDGKMEVTSRFLGSGGRAPRKFTERLSETDPCHFSRAPGASCPLLGCERVRLHPGDVAQGRR